MVAVQLHAGRDRRPARSSIGLLVGAQREEVVHRARGPRSRTSTPRSAPPPFPRRRRGSAGAPACIDGPARARHRMAVLAECGERDAVRPRAATEQVLETCRRAGVEETDEAVAPAPEALPAWRALAPGPRRAPARPDRRARGRARGAGRRWRRATPASRSAPRAARSAVDRDVPLLLRGPERLLGDTIPVDGGIAMTFREPIGVVGADHAVELPARDRLVEARAGARRRQHRRAQAGRADAADRAALRADRARGRGARRASSTSSSAPGAPAGSGSSSIPDVGKIAFTGSTEVGALDRRAARRDDQARDARAGRQVGERRLRRRRRRGRRGGGAGRRVRQRRAGLLRALAHPRRARRGRPLPRGARAGRRGDPRRRPARRGDRDGAADLGRPARDASARSCPRARRSRSAAPPPTGRGYWFAPTVLHPVDPGDRAATEEIFGPVACVIPFSDEAEAIRARQRHDLRAVGLGLDARRRQGAARRARARDRRTSRSTRTPRSGSRRRSAASSRAAYGRELGPHALERYTEVKTVYYRQEASHGRASRGKVCVVTGASGGIGSATVAAFQREGATVAASTSWTARPATCR